MRMHTAKLRWVIAAAAGSLALGTGVAAAVVVTGDGPTGVASSETTEPTAPSATVVTTPNGSDGASEPGTAPTTVQGATGDTTGTTAGRYWDDECGPEPMNHGQYVRSQAKGGPVRSAAAQSDCGKPSGSVAGDDADEVEAPDADEVEAPEPPEAPENEGPEASEPSDEGAPKSPGTGAGDESPKTGGNRGGRGSDG